MLNQSVKSVADVRCEAVPRPRPAHLSIKLMIKTWWLETLACLLLFAIIIAVVITMRAQQGKPLYHWPYNLSINTIISVYAVVMKASIVLIVSEGLGQLKWIWYNDEHPLKDIENFDKASRGEVYGSFLLVWNLRQRNILATLAVFITLAVMLVDPFSQQITQYYNCAILDGSSVAQIPRTNRYDFVGSEINPRDTTIDVGLQGTINAGILVPQSTRVMPVCQTGNCTFGSPIQTLGFCSSCIDITNEIQVSNASVKDLFGSGNYIRTNISLPSGPSSAKGQDTGGIQYFLNVQWRNISVIEFLATYLDPAENPVCKDPSNKSWVCQGAGAARCNFQPCVKTFSANIESGQLTETLLDTHVIPNTDLDQNWTGSVVDLNCLKSSGKGNLTKDGSGANSQAQWTAFNPSLHGQDPSKVQNPQLKVPRECVYSIAFESDISIMDYCAELLSGQIEPEDQAQTPQLATGKPALAAMYQQGNVSFETVNSALGHLTESMTSFVRGHGAAGWSQPSEGQTWRTDTCVGVEWGWLALPAALTGLTLLFFGALIFQTRRGEVGNNHNWKCSTLPVLYHGLDPRTRYNQGELAKLDAMDEDAKKLQVRLNLTNEGWRFTPVN